MATLILPKELLQFVVDYLPAATIGTWMTLNKSYFNLLSHDRVWHRHYRSDWVIPFDIEQGQYWRHYPFLSTFQELFEPERGLTPLISEITERINGSDTFCYYINFIAGNQPIPLMMKENRYRVHSVICTMPWYVNGAFAVVVSEILPLNTTASFQTVRTSVVGNHRTTIFASWNEFLPYLDKIRADGYISVNIDISLDQNVVAHYRSYFQQK